MFASAARFVSGRDLIEEYLAAKVWPLMRDWLPGAFSKVLVVGLKDNLPFPDFGLWKPVGVSDDMIVEEIEQEAVAIAGPFLSKERDSFEAICSEKVRVNRSFLKMWVLYGPREAPREKKRGGKYFCALREVIRRSDCQEGQEGRAHCCSVCEGSESSR